MTLILVMAVVIVLPIAFFGIPSGNDLPQHYQFAMTYRENLDNGNLMPSWSDRSNFGYGDVGVRFYPPLGYYVLAGFETLSGNWFDASVLAFGFWFFLGGSGVYLWCRERFSPNASLFGAAVYTIAPYHVNQIYNAFTYAEFAAAGVLPFCFLFAERICKRRDWISSVGFAISFALLLLTHIPMALLGSIGICIYLAAALPRERWFRAVRQSCVGFTLGLAASSFYLTRVVTEIGFVNHAGSKYSSEGYDFHVNFLGSWFYLSSQAYEARSLGFADISLVITLALFIPGLVILFARERSGGLRPLLAAVAVLCFALLIATPVSLTLWEHIGVLRMIQFPWRAMVLISLCAAVLAAAGYKHITQAFGGRYRPLGLVAFGMIAAGIVFTANQVIRPSLFQQREAFLRKMPTLENAKSCECWWSIWSKETAFDIREKVNAGDRAAEIDNWDANQRSFHVAAGKAGYARVAAFYYPYWRANLNGSAVEVEHDGDGAILVPLPPDSAKVQIEFHEPAYLRIGNWFSLLVWIALAAFTGLYLFRDRRLGIR